MAQNQNIAFAVIVSDKFRKSLITIIKNILKTTDIFSFIVYPTISISFSSFRVI